MRRSFVVFIISLFSSLAFAQQPKQVQLVSSQVLKGLQQKGLVRIIRPVFSHEGSTLAADSADYNAGKNKFDAYGNVVIAQSNGTTVYSDVLNYDGNTKLAILTKNVRLVDGDATLTTDFLTYNMGTRIGTYANGGKIVNGQNVVTSKRGYYFANSRDAYFRNDVAVTSPEALIKSDTLRYNSTSKIAYFYGPTRIYGKDDTLYTENGEYNTLTDQARFGKKNLYTQGSKSLKGDSLFYDRKLGYGRAIKNITFVDAAEKITFRGDIGHYRKADESILATKNAYVILTTESDSSKVDSIWMTADTLFSKKSLNRLIRPARKEELKKDTELEEPEALSAGDAKEGQDVPVQEGDSVKTVNPRQKKNEQKPKEVLKAKDQLSTVDTVQNRGAKDTVASKDRITVLQPEQKPPAVKSGKPSGKVKDRKSRPESVGKTVPAPVKVPAPDTLSQDTSTSRIVMAYHHAKIFKSDLQAKSDSMFFSYGDSIVRCYRDPMIWTQGSQLSGDTVYLQMKNKKLDNMLLQHNSFIVNTEGDDSTHFNQVKGKVITGYFRDSKLDRMYVDGNAESIYYVKEDTAYSGMNRMVSSRIKILFADKKLKDIISIRKPEGKYYPIDQIPKDEEILKGFIWKPKIRPRSKEEIIPGLAGMKKPARPVTKPVQKQKTQPVPAKKPANTKGGI